MRTIYSGAGADVTSSYVTLRANSPSIWMADLFWFQFYDFWGSNLKGDALNVFLTDGDYPISVPTLQTGPAGKLSSPNQWTTFGGDLVSIPNVWKPAVVTRDNLNYTIGFEDNPLEVTWGIEDNEPFFNANCLAYPSSTLACQPDGYGPGTTGGIFPWASDRTAPFTSSSGSLLGAFIDSSGNATGQPFFIGNGPYTTRPAPAGTVALSIGVNSGHRWQTVNSGFWPIFYSTSVGNAGQLIVPATAGPWSPTDPSYSYTANGGFLPTASITVPILPGQTVSLQYGYGPGFTPPFTVKQALLAGYCDGAPFWYHKAIFTADPKQGGTLLGTVLMFRGYVRDVEAATNYLKITVASLMESFQQVQVPTQLVQPGNRSVQITPPPPTADLGPVLSTSTPTDLQFSTAGVADHLYEGGFVILGGDTTYGSANPAGGIVPTFVRIQDNLTLSGILHLYPMEPLLVPISIMDTLSVSAWSQSSLDNSFGAPGFPYVPGPNTA